MAWPSSDLATGRMHKIGVISDIHGDAQSLDQALHFLLHVEHVQEVVCLGDLVDKGPHNDIVVAAIAQSGMVCVMGNHDYDNVHGTQQWLRENLSPTAALYQSNILSDASIRYLSTLPPMHTLTINNVVIDMAHGSPTRLDEYIFPHKVKTALKSYCRSSKSNVLLLGHTHTPMALWHQGKLVANPGSIAGHHSSGSRTFGVLTLDPLQFSVHDVDSGLPIVLHDHSVK